jgi:hypothetical protein
LCFLTLFELLFRHTGLIFDLSFDKLLTSFNFLAALIISDMDKMSGPLTEPTETPELSNPLSFVTRATGPRASIKTSPRNSGETQE